MISRLLTRSTLLASFRIAPTQRIDNETVSMIGACGYSYDYDQLRSDQDLLVDATTICQKDWSAGWSSVRPYGSLLVVLQTMEAKFVPTDEPIVEEHIDYFMQNTVRPEQPTLSYVTPLVMDRLTQTATAREYLARMLARKGFIGSGWLPINDAERQQLCAWQKHLA